MPEPLPSNAFYAPTVLPLVEELLARGIAPAAIEEQLRRSLLELRTPFLCIPLLLSQRLWAFAASASGDPQIGLAAGRRFVSTLTNGLTYLVDTAPTLEAACRYFVEYFPYFNGHYTAAVVHDAGGVALCLHESGSLRPRPAATDYILIGICSLLRRKLLASGLQRDPILAIELPRPPANAAAAYQQAFAAPLRWDGASPAIHLDAELFSQPLAPGDQELEQLLVGLLEQARAHSLLSLQDQVCDYIAGELAHGPSLVDFCARWHLTERTVARRLKASGWSFSELLEEHRRYRAEDLLADATLSLANISDLLGYGDVQSFTRSCLRWFGCPPGAWRAAQ